MPDRTVAEVLAEQTARFWSKVDKSRGDDGCWIWLGSHGKWGHGVTPWTEVTE